MNSALVNSVLYLTLFLVLWAPIPLGSNRDWSEAFLEMLVCLAVSLLLLGQYRRTLSLKPLDDSVRPLLWSGGFVLAWLLIQLLPLRGGLLPLGFYGALVESGLLPHDEKNFPISYSSAATRGELLLWISLLGAFYLTYVLSTIERYRPFLINAFILAGGGVSLFGLINFMSDGAWGYFRPATKDWGLGVTGTFVNKNHYAGFVIMLLPLAMVSFVSRLRRVRLERSSVLNDWRAMFFLTCGLLMAIGLFFSGSRGGLISLLVVMLVFLLFRKSKKAFWVASFAIPLFTVLAFFFLLPQLALFERFFFENTLTGRIDQWLETFPLIIDNWLFGVGAGAYVVVFPAYKSGALGILSYEYVHNDYLQWLAELGLGALAVFALLGVILKRSIRLMTRAPDRAGYANGLALGLFAFMLHGFLDFNFRIPANSHYFMMLAGMLFAADVRNRRSGSAYAT